MKFLERDFEAVWKHCQARALEDMAAKRWIPSVAGNKANLIVHVGDLAVEVVSNAPVGSSDKPRKLPKSEFRRYWEFQLGERESFRFTNQATGVLVERYFDDAVREGDGSLVFIVDDESGDGEHDDKGAPSREAADGGLKSYEYEVSARRGEVEGLHLLVYGALLEQTRTVEGWQVSRIPADSRVSPDLVIESQERGERVIFEVKSGATLADVYQAIGQLHLYRHYFWPQDDFRHFLVMVLFGGCNSDVAQAVRACGVSIITASKRRGKLIIDSDIEEFLND